MAVRWYYKVMGQQAGPVSSSELKSLAASGFLTPDVLLRKGDEGAWFPAGNVRGLYDDGFETVAGEGSEGPAAAEPGASGGYWYYEVLGQETGPLSMAQLRDLAKSGFITPDVGVRQGTEGPWRKASGVAGLFEQAGGPAGATGSRAGARIRKRPLAPPAAPKPPPGEIVREAVEKGPAAAPPARTQTADIGWYYQARGRATGPVPPTALKDLADSGALVPETLVRKGAEGRWVAAGQVKGLFERRAAGASSEEAERPAAEKPGGGVSAKRPPPSVPILMAYPVGEPVLEPAPEPPPGSGLELLPESALEPLPPQPARSAPPPAGGMGDLLDEALSGSIPLADGPALPPPPRARRRAARPGHAAGSPFAGGSGRRRRRRRRGPGMVGQIIVGGFMTFIGGLGVVVLPIILLLLCLALVGLSLGAGGLPVRLAAAGVILVLVWLTYCFVALIGTYYIFTGGIGILRGRVDGADRGAMGCGIALVLEVIGVIIHFVLAAMASGGDVEQATRVQDTLTWTLTTACFRSAITGALLWWCKTAGQRLPD